MLKISSNTVRITTIPKPLKKEYKDYSINTSQKEPRKNLKHFYFLTKFTEFKKRLKKKANTVDFELLENANIPNYSAIHPNGARGETLSSRKNRRHIKTLKEAGINTIIDLRNQYTSETYPKLCKQNNIRYYNIPIDSAEIDDRKIIKKLPLLFKLLNQGNYYIACAQGLHRTDIALSINYVFNPKAKEIPVLKGHLRENTLKTEDIARRLNSIKKALTDKDIKSLGWKEGFEEAFEERKENLFNYNQSLIEAYA